MIFLQNFFIFSKFNFLGLRDVKLNREQLSAAYIECIQFLRDMMVGCNLVHADYSEYNLLYHQNHIWVIDVSQSVERDHPYAFEFLKRDIHNTNSYFSKLGVLVFRRKYIFDFVTDEELPREQEAERIEGLKEDALEHQDTEDDIKKFLWYEIPRSLSIYFTMEEIEFKLNEIRLNLDTKIFGRYIGRDERKLFEDEVGEPGEVSEKSVEEVELPEEVEVVDKRKLPPKVRANKRNDPFEGMTKQERKQLVKEQKREKRKEKMPKKKKKQLMKKGKRK